MNLPARKRAKTGPFGEGGALAKCKVCGKQAKNITMYEAFYSWYCSWECYRKDKGR